MALQKQTIGYNFTSGLDTKTDGLLVDPPYLTRLENGVFTRRGSIKKRFGYQPLNRKIFPTDGEFTTGRALGTFFDELVLLSNDQLYSRTTNSSSWVAKGPHCHVKISTKCLVSDENFYGGAAIATCGNSTAYTYAKATSISIDGIHATAKDRITGTQYYSNDVVEAGSRDTKAVTVGTTMFMFYRPPIPTTLLRFFPIPCAGDPSISGQTTYDANFTGAAYSVAATAAFGGAAVVAWTHTDGFVHLAYLTPNGFKGGPGNGFPPETVGFGNVDRLHLHIDPNNNNIIILTRLFGVEVRVRVYDSSFVLLNDTQLSVSFNDIDSGYNFSGVTGANGDQYLFWGNQNTTARQQDRLRKAVVNFDGSVIVTPASTFKVGGPPLASPFVVGTRTILPTGWISPEDPSNFLIDADTGTVYARFLHAEGLTSTGGALRAVESSPGVWLLATSKRGKLIPRAASETLQYTSDIVEVTFDFTHPRPCMEQVGRNLLVASGVMKTYDGDSLTELNFLIQPDGTAVTAGAGALTGTYVYRFVYEWIDNQGLIQRSVPSNDFPLVLVANQVTLTVFTPGWTDKLPPRRDSARVKIYRTLANGTIFYELPITPPIPWDTVTGAVTFTDNTLDALLAIQPLIYTTGGELANDAPPSATVCTFSKNRVWLGDTENGQIWYSKQTVEGESVAFNLALQIRPTVPVTALAALDDKLVVFGQNTMFVLSGDGPNALGEQDSFTPLQLVSSDVGCVDFRSVVESSMGMFFKSEKGIYGLTRALEAQYVGAPVERFNAQQITDATLVDDVNQIRFLTDSGQTLLYDYLFDAWASWTNFFGVDAALWRGQYVHLHSDGNALGETVDQYLDIARNIPLLLETAWIKSAGVKGWHRVYNIAVLGEFRTVHKLIVRAAFDYQPFADQELVWDTSQGLPQIFYGTIGPYGTDPVYGSRNDAVYQFEAKLSRQKCEAIKLQFEDTSDTPGEAYILAHLMLAVGMKSGTYRLPDAKRLG